MEPPTLRPSQALDQAERLLVAGSFPAAAEAAQRVLADVLAGGAADEEEDAEDLSFAAAAVLVQARRFAGDTPATLLALLKAAFGSLHAVPPDALVLWARLTLAAGETEAARDALSEALAYEPGERLRHPQPSLAAAARMLAVDVWAGALGDPAGALKWLAVGGTAVMTTDARRALMHEINERKQAAEAAAAADKQRAEETAAAASGSAAAAGAKVALDAFPVPAAAGPSGFAAAAAGSEAARGAPVPDSSLGGVGTSLRGLLQRGTVAARADPAAATLAAVVGSSAVLLAFMERRSMRTHLARAGVALAQLAWLGVGSGPVAAPR